ncbi:MAG TPA: alanine racemase [Firmicutes bacterium]|nr:alanine racemase [Bacillota bacterium]
MNRHQERIRPAWVEINLAAIGHNIREVRRLVGPTPDIMAVVKAEAYGHGAVPVAKAAIAAGASWLGVAMPEEGITLRTAGLTVPILILGPIQPDQVKPVVEHGLTAALCNWEAAVAMSEEAGRTGKTALAHLKVDTGMGRIGIVPSTVVEFMAKLKNLPGLQVSGIFSHMATADERDKSYARKQIETFSTMVAALRSSGLLPDKVHLANSAGIMELPASHFNMVRPGIILYGLYPSNEVDRQKASFEPALTLKTKVTFIKRVPQGTGISYGQRYHTGRESTIATIPIGYADGWSRMLTNKAEALVRGKRFPIVGTICMDQCMIDLGDEPVRSGEEVILIGKSGRETITADEIAESLGTINYEVACMLNNRLPRMWINEHE